MALGLVIPFLLRKRLLRFLVPFCLVLLIVGGWMISQDGGMRDFVSLYHRFYIWKVSWLMWLEHPFFGVSASGFKEAFPLFASPDLAASFNLPDPTNLYWTSASHAHNLFLMVLAVSGIAGLAAFSWLLINAVRMALRTGQDWRSGLVSWPVVFLAIGMIGTNIYDGMSLTLFAFFLVLIGDIKAV
jgi:O-antigen ligase